MNTVEGELFIVQQFYKGVNYTASWYFGQGFNLAGSALDNSINPFDTADRIATTSPSYPTTNDWQDIGSTRQLLDYSAPAVEVTGLARKFAPPITNLTALITQDVGPMTYIISVDGFGPGGILLGVYDFPGEDPPVIGDFLEVTVTNDVEA